MNDRKPFEWINEESITFLRRGYLSEGEEPLQRIKIIADHAEKLLGIDGFADKFYGYMSKGWLVILYFNSLKAIICLGFQSVMIGLSFFL